MSYLGLYPRKIFYIINILDYDKNIILLIDKYPKKIFIDCEVQNYETAHSNKRTNSIMIK